MEELLVYKVVTEACSLRSLCSGLNERSSLWQGRLLGLKGRTKCCATKRPSYRQLTKAIEQSGGPASGTRGPQDEQRKHGFDPESGAMAKNPCDSPVGPGSEPKSRSLPVPSNSPGTINDPLELGTRSDCSTAGRRRTRCGFSRSSENLWRAPQETEIYKTNPPTPNPSWKRDAARREQRDEAHSLTKITERAAALAAYTGIDRYTGADVRLWNLIIGRGPAAQLRSATPIAYSDPVTSALAREADSVVSHDALAINPRLVEFSSASQSL